MRWLFAQYDLVERARWDEWTGAVAAAETGVIRALAVSFSSKRKNLPPLPTWKELIRTEEEAVSGLSRRSNWIERFERVNRIGKYAVRDDDDDNEGDL